MRYFQVIIARLKLKNLLFNYFFIFIITILLISNVLALDIVNSAENISDNILLDNILSDELSTTEEVEELESDDSKPASVKNDNPVDLDSTSSRNYNKAKVIALNKITAKSKELLLSIGEVQYFGNIGIKIHKCLKDLNPYSPTDSLLLTVTENKIDEDQSLIFQGWLISSNLTISTLEHPVYEVFIKECL